MADDRNLRDAEERGIWAQFLTAAVQTGLLTRDDDGTIVAAHAPATADWMLAEWRKRAEASKAATDPGRPFEVD